MHPCLRWSISILLLHLILDQLLCIMRQRRVENPRYIGNHAFLWLDDLDLSGHQVLVSSLSVSFKFAVLAHFELDLPRSQFAHCSRPGADLGSLLGHWSCGGSLRPVVVNVGITDGRHFTSLLGNLLLGAIQVLCLSIIFLSIIVDESAGIIRMSSLRTYITVFAQRSTLFLKQVAIALFFSFSSLFRLNLIRSCVQWLPSHLRLTFIECRFIDLVIAQVSVLLGTYSTLAMMLVVQSRVGRLLPPDYIGLDLFFYLFVLTALCELIVQVVGLIHIDQVVWSLNHVRRRRDVLAVHL